MVRDLVEIEAACRMRTVLVTYRRVFQEFVDSGLRPAVSDALAACMDEIRSAKLHLFRLMPCEVIDLVLGHSEIMTFLWQRQFNDIRGLPAALGTSPGDEGAQLLETHERALARVDAACRAIIGVSDADRAPVLDLVRSFGRADVGIGR